MYPSRHVAAQRVGGFSQPGFTYIELLVALLIGSLLMVGITDALSTSIKTNAAVQGKNALNQQARFAMQRMQQAVSSSPRLLLPLGDRAVSIFIKENERNLLAITLPHHIDNDGDGIGDADNDKDGRFDEDLPADASNDSAPGIFGIDDDGDGSIDEGSNIADDDEFLSIADEDGIDGSDSDGDGTIDDDPPADMNGDGWPGIENVDDDGDGDFDEGDAADDDEDGEKDEDWYDPVVFYIDNGSLIERTPVPWDEDNSGGPVDGRDFIEQSIAENVTLFNVVREPMTDERAQLLTLTLQLTNSNGQSVQLNTQVRVGGAL